MSEYDPNKPYAYFTVDKNSGAPPLTVTFTNISQNPRGLTPRWDFGDGSPWAYGDIVTHTYVNVNTTGFPATLGLMGEFAQPDASTTVPIVVKYANTGTPTVIRPTKLEAVGKNFNLKVIDSVLIDTDTSVQLNVTVESLGSNVAPNLKKDFTIRINRIAAVI